MSRRSKRREFVNLSHEGVRVYRVTYHLNFTTSKDARLVAAKSPSEAIAIMKRELNRPESYTFQAERATVLAVWEEEAK